MRVPVLISRQPIFADEETLFGYEVRSTPAPNGTGAGFPAAEARTELDLLAVEGQDLPVFLRVHEAGTAQLLQSPEAECLKRVKPILELFPTGPGSPDPAEAAQRFKKAGYGIAVDEQALQPDARELLELADIVRLRLPFMRKHRAALDPLLASGYRLLAADLSNHHELREAEDLGGDLFQGFFFCQPRIDGAAEVPHFKANYLLFLTELAAREIDLGRVEEIVKREQSLALRLLRYLNTPLFGVRNRISSVRMALVHLGQEPLRRWGSVMAVSGLGDDGPGALVLTSMVRARFCELLGRIEAPAHSGAYFLTGLFSTVDALLNQPLERCLGQLTLEPEIRRAILGEFNPLGQALQLAIAFERGDWSTLLARLESDGAGMDVKALRWADGIFGLDGSRG